MATFFLIIIYLAFISLGLPDSVLGSAWPVMQPDFAAPLETAGVIAMFVAGCTIVSSLASGYVIRRYGTGLITLVSCMLTAGALLGFSVSPSVVWLIVFAVPLGLGAGAVDAGLNNYVAVHYKAHHMSWLHCFWGVGATLGPIVMSRYIALGDSWRDAYRAIFYLQLGLVVLLFVTLPLWKRKESAGAATKETREEERHADPPSAPEKPLRIKGVKLALLAFLFYCGAEATIGLWGSSFLVRVKDLSAGTAAQWVSLYYGGITVGRFITGFVTFRMSNTALIRAGQTIALLGALLLLLPLPSVCSLIGFILVGFGLAPIFPSMLHETPARFGKTHSQTIIGYQMAMAYTGTTLLPPMLGGLATYATIGIFPFFVAGYILLMFLSTERIHAMMRARLSGVNDIDAGRATSP